MLRLRFTLAAVVAGALVAPADAADAVFPPGSRIGLVPPSDMQPARGVAGFRNPRTGAAIVALEMPAEAFPSLAAGFSDEALKQQGFRLEERDTVDLPSGRGILVTGEQREGDRLIAKSVLLASDPTLTAVVIAQLPSGSTPAEIATVRDALRSVAFRPPLTMDEQLAALPFRVGDLAGFRPVRAMAGNSLFLTEGPGDVIRDASQPIMIVAKSFAPGPPSAGRDLFAKQALYATNFIKDPVLERSQLFRQDGAEWQEIVAKATDAATGTPVIVMQTIRFDPDSYVRSVGIAKADARDDALPRFRRIVDSVVSTE